MKPNKEKGEAFEKLAFQFCKIATFCLIFQKFALILAAFGAGLFFLLAEYNGKRDTSCIGKHPKLIALFWFIIGSFFVWWQFFRD
jgi:hypothetical protein